MISNKAEYKLQTITQAIINYNPSVQSTNPKEGQVCGIKIQ